MAIEGNRHGTTDRLGLLWPIGSGMLMALGAAEP
jgi:hypothetical protein